MMLPTSFRIFLGLCLFASTAYSSRILAVFPTVSKSHFDFFQPLLLALASRGHDVTVVNSYPQPRPVTNYTDINLQDFKKVFFNNFAFDLLPRVPANFLDTHFFLMSQIEENEPTFSHPDVRRLLDSEESFDLIITELWNSDVFLAFTYKFKAPVVAMSSSGILPWGNARFGNPDNPSYIPNVLFDKFGQLDFLQRLVNTYQIVISKMLYTLVFNPSSERIARRVFGDFLPPLEALALNTSLLLVNTHHSLHGSRPLSPQVVEIGGIHVAEPKPLQTVLLAKLYQRFVLNRVSEAMSKRYFGDDTPALEETLKTSSLLLVNSHFTFFSPKPLPPQVVEVGGIHVKPSKPVIEVNVYVHLA